MEEYRARRLLTSDYRQLESMWSKHFTAAERADRLERLRWIVEENPHSATNDDYIVLVDESERVVAYTGIMSARFRLGGKDVQGHIYQDSMVDPAMRRRGLGSRLLLRMLEDYPSFSIAVWMTEINATLFGKCGWKPVDGVFDYVKIFDVRPTLCARWGGRAARLAPVVNALAAFYASALRGLRALRSRLRRVDRSAYEVVPLERFDRDADELFDRVKQDFTCIGFRTADILNWKYASFDSSSHRKLACKRDGELVGYLVFRVCQEQDRRIAKIYELLCLPTEMDALEPLLDKALELCKQERVAEVHAITTARAYATCLRRAGFIRARRNDAALKYVHNADEVDDATLRAAESWFFTYGDGDMLFWQR